jgi:hypothetical protein
MVAHQRQLVGAALRSRAGNDSLSLTNSGTFGIEETLKKLLAFSGV